MLTFQDVAAPQNECSRPDSNQSSGPDAATVATERHGAAHPACSATPPLPRMLETVKSQHPKETPSSISRKAGRARTTHASLEPPLSNSPAGISLAHMRRPGLEPGVAIALRSGGNRSRCYRRVSHTLSDRVWLVMRAFQTHHAPGCVYQPHPCGLSTSDANLG